MVPDRKLGIVVLTNQEPGETFEAITYHILDHYLGAPAFDWLEGYTIVKARRDSGAAAGGWRWRTAVRSIRVGPGGRRLRAR
jgi:hypothetical protein